MTQTVKCILSRLLCSILEFHLSRNSAFSVSLRTVLLLIGQILGTIVLSSFLPFALSHVVFWLYLVIYRWVWWYLVVLWWYCVVFGGIFVVFGVTIAIFLLLVSSFFPGHMWSCLCAAQTNVHPPQVLLLDYRFKRLSPHTVKSKLSLSYFWGGTNEKSNRIQTYLSTGSLRFEKL